MNGFRITLLILLALSVAALLGIVTIFQNSQEANYEAYLASVKAHERQQTLAAHLDEMRRIGPQEASAADADAMETARKEQEQQVTQEEERNVLASATRKDAAREAEKTVTKVREDDPIGLVNSYNREWGFIMVKPVADVPMTSGTAVAIRRNGRIICEADLGEEELDDQTGARLISATLRENQFTRGDGDVSADKYEPAPGDDVIISPFMSSTELRNGAESSDSPAPLQPATDASAEQSAVPQEQPAQLIALP